MRLSRGFLPTLKENPAEAQIASHRLMLRAGLIRQTAAGIYAWLPAGLRVLRNIAQIVREEQDAIGAQEVLMPTLQPAELWRRSGRYEAYGPEMLRLTDRHERDLLYGPTNEEMITDLFGQSVRSYRELPQVLYQIHWKFRDEVRPRFGVMRGREFLMKDAYSFDTDPEAAVATYRRMLLAYLRTFQRLGVAAIPMVADAGPIGGNHSHEFIILAPTGESGVFYDGGLEEQDWLSSEIDLADREALAGFFTRVTSLYAATDEKHDEAAWAEVPADRRREGRGIEVGHIFYFGTKYTESMGISVSGADGAPFHPEMGSYGIGVSRLAGAIIEASHDEAGIIWPDAVAPYKAAILNLKPGDAGCDALCERLYGASPDALLLDDRSERAGVKFNDADLMGHPWQVIVGPRGAAAGRVELKRRATGERVELSPEEALERIGLPAVGGPGGHAA
ncbi:proline--tRNA ligase [Lichenicoccus roseus]|uniref:Proline--tRNA ligase n=1 Tax=Lichenicoccus roseus TaxID=2683649 RepID=A0A5R9JAU9_9PROT|nr:proline--tRNA ligase [Lichenicoccus roseus]TLU72731.1 proline--tRNA ligase [Lichenicoccus roseus]